MDLTGFLQKLGNNFKTAIKSSETDKMNFYHLCNTLTMKFITSHKVNFVEKLQGLIAAFIIYGKMRIQQSERKNLVIATNYLTNLAVETGRLVLSYEYTTLATGSPTKDGLLTTVSKLKKTLQSMPHESRLMEALEHVIVNGWDHPVLVKLITGAEIDEEIGLSYLKCQEHPNFLKLRLDLLMCHGCCEHAANFLSWLLRFQDTGDDHYLIYLHLSYLFITGQFQEFFSRCNKLPCTTASRVMTNVMVHPHHCFSSPLMPLLLSRTLVSMTVLNNEYFCNKEIIKQWVKTEHQHSQNTKETFECRISDLAQNVAEPKFIINLIEILHQEYQKAHVTLCTKLIMKALTMSRHAYDCARLYLVDSFTNQAAFRCMLALLHLLEKLYCENTLIRVYCQISNMVLMPCDAKYFAVEKTCLELQSQFSTETCDENSQLENVKAAFINSPLEKALYQLISTMVDRFNNMRPWQWDAIMKPAMLSVMADAGWSYDPILRRFRKCKVLMNSHNFNSGLNRNFVGSIENIKHAQKAGPVRSKKVEDDDFTPKNSLLKNLRKRTRRKTRTRHKKRLRIIEDTDDSEEFMSDYDVKSGSDEGKKPSYNSDEDEEDEVTPESEINYEKEVELKNECMKFINSARVRLKRLPEIDNGNVKSTEADDNCQGSKRLASDNDDSSELQNNDSVSQKGIESTVSQETDIKPLEQCTMPLLSELKTS